MKSSIQQKSALGVGRALESRGHWWRAARLYEATIPQVSLTDAEDLKFRAAYCRVQTKRYDLALAHLSTFVSLESTNTLWLHLYATVLSKLGRHHEAVDFYSRCIQLNPSRPEWYLQLADAATNAKEIKIAIRRLEDALLMWPENVEICDQLAKNLNKDQGRWRELEVLQHGLEFERENKSWNARLADCLFYLRRYAEASQYYAKSRILDSKKSEFWYLEGLSYKRAGLIAESRNAFDEVIRRDSRLNLSHFGIGAYHQSKGNWADAADSYSETVKSSFNDPEIHYRLGICRERMYDWTAARDSYVQAIALDPSKSHWHYRLAYVLERDHEYEKAAEAYVWSASSGKDNIAFRWFRAGYASANAGQFQLACLRFLKAARQYGFVAAEGQLELEMAEKPQTDSNFLSKFTSEIDVNSGVKISSKFFETQGDSELRENQHSAAAESYREAIFLRNGTKYALHAKHALALMNAGKYEDAVASFIQMRQFARPTGVDERPYMKGPQTRRNMAYAEYRDTLPVEQNVFFFESSHGSAIHCNPYAMYQELKKRDNFGDFKIVWVLNDMSKCPMDILTQSNVLVVKQHSDAYLRYLATAKYLINNVTFPIYFSRRDGQKYLNTWHGTPLKLMGKLVKGAHYEHKNVARNFAHVTHFFLPNQHTHDCLVRDHDLGGLVTPATLLKGSPRIDRTLSLSHTRRKEVREQLSISDGQKVVLYAPTWRGQMGDHVFDSDGLVQDLSAMADGGHKLLFRAHRFAEKAIGNVKTSAQIVPPDIDTNELLAIVDVLVTDYSSIFYDFLPLGREIVFYTPDYEQYAEERGLYVPREEWPGEVFDDVDQLRGHLKAVTTSAEKFVASSKQVAYCREFAGSESGHASSDALEFLLSEEVETASVPDKKNLLFYQGSFMPNGILTSFISLVNALDLDKYRVTVAIDSNLVKQGSEADDILSGLQPGIQVIARAGTVVLSSEEHAISDQFHKRGNFYGNEQHELFRSMMQKEYRRIFGDIRFDVAIDFEGYSRFWGAIFSNPATVDTKSVIYLHNDMTRERDSKYPRMDTLFRIYNDFDSLISVSESVNEVNREQIGFEYGINPSKFVFANNTIDTERPLQLASALENHGLVPDSFRTGKLFANMARLSPEKGHEKLLEAFAVIAFEDLEANLLIMGDGPLRTKLQKRIAELGLDERVLLLGQISNPFPILKQCDCFVFSSEYEGQGLAMIEAMMMGLTVVSTDVVGSRSVVENGCGILTENSSDGLVRGMRRFISGERAGREFSATEYQKVALAQFESIIG